MRDPRAGSYGVVAVVLLLALKIAALGSLPPALRMPALIVAPCLGRWGIVLATGAFPYARPEGMGATSRSRFAGRTSSWPAPSRSARRAGSAESFGTGCLDRRLAGGPARRPVDRRAARRPERRHLRRDLRDDRDGSPRAVRPPGRGACCDERPADSGDPARSAHRTPTPPAPRGSARPR